MHRKSLILLLLLPLMAWGQTAPLHPDAEVRVWSLSHAMHLPSEEEPDTLRHP